ncbi:hypothetical protein R3P38DRAFT_2905094 [Favolaschia claudopus]|uniref:Protein kinase domain-containing protein n=1 Tax=Favolaschia claudopus TaxID=2862362 RepID=A0AAW0CF83_9AGAR
MPISAATRVWVRFEGIERDFVAKQWPIPDHSNSFTPPPVDAHALFIPAKNSFAMNGAGDRRSQQFPFSFAKTWGLHENSYRDVVYARASKKYCLRFIFNVEQTLRSAKTDPFKAYVRLVKDAIFHSDHLEGKGLPVPVHYGIWAMNTGDLGGVVLFSLTQYCGVSWNELHFTKFNTEANRLVISIGRAYEALHDAGIEHGDFMERNEFRHAFIDLYAPGLTKEDALNGKAPFYVVGFSEASANHACRRQHPVLPLDSYPTKEVSCPELRGIMFLLEFPKTPAEASILAQALEWHAEYSKRHPKVENRYVLVAQRKRFYPQFPPLDPALHDDLYCRVLITRDAISHGDECTVEAQQAQPSGSQLQHTTDATDLLPSEYRTALAENKLSRQFIISF